MVEGVRVTCLSTYSVLDFAKHDSSHMFLSRPSLLTIKDLVLDTTTKCCTFHSIEIIAVRNGSSLQTFYSETSHVQKGKGEEKKKAGERLKVSEHCALKKQNTFLFSLIWFFKLYINM